jgi:heavy metal sensor kinase
MPSIRFSLTCYFLVLLFAALGGGSLIVYRTTESSLQARERAVEVTLRAKREATAEMLRVKHQSTREMLEARLREKSKAEEARLDEALLTQARTLARLSQFHVDSRRTRHWDLKVLGVMTAPAMPFGALTTPVWTAQSVRGSDFNMALFWRVFATSKEIKFDRNDLLEHVDEQVAEYFQINSAWGHSYLSHKMDGRAFDFNYASVFGSGSESLDVGQADDTTLGGVKVRRMKLLAPFARFVPFGPSRYRPPGRPPGDHNPSHSPDRGPFPRQEPPFPRQDPLMKPAIYVQCACSTARRDAAIAEMTDRLRGDVAVLEAKRDEDLAGLTDRLNDDLSRLQEETTTALATLRRHLLLLCLVTFTLGAAGTLALVRFGLVPLQRLSEAVSRVSEKDFRLQLDEKRLPRELTPIAERLSQTLDQLKRAFAREKQATADISHELRTPLAALMTTIDVTLRKPRTTEEYRDALTDCRASGQQINEAVERLLALARLDAGVDRVRAQKVDAVDVARQCVSVLRPLAEARGLSIALHAEEPAVVQTDPDKLREVLNNLLHNAIEYNRPNGSIDVAVQRDNGHVALHVRDTGIGIDPSARSHIFERFYRADPSRQADGLHAGLGLAIVKGYLELMGGTIEVESTQGQGSTFCVSLPA